MTSSDIVLCTLNSTYQHTAFGLRYLLANMGPLKSQTAIYETTIKETPRNIIEKILRLNPRIVGFGVYIWNTAETLECISILKKVSPQTIIVLGGPEISYETDRQEHLKWCDYVICGEADFQFRELCLAILTGQNPPSQQILSASLPDIKQIQLPYNLYADEDITNRVIYVEASRGCPYRCEYCLSSLDKSVRSFDLATFLEQMEQLIGRGVRTFKFVDRTFNLSPSTATAILNFFLRHIDRNLFLHFEMVPDRLPAEIRELIQLFPAGSLQFEVGIQTLNPTVAQNVSRKNDLLKVEENFRFLKERTQVHTHADLIAGLPGETLESFASGFDRLAAFLPDEIQVGLLKRLKGTPISRHEKTFKMLYSEKPPYQILSTSTLSYQELQQLGRFAKFWDLYANSGHFKNFVAWFKNSPGSFFWNFFEFCEFLSLSFTETHSLSPTTLAEQACLFLQKKGLTPSEASTMLIQDLTQTGRQLPPFLRELASAESGMSKNLAPQKKSVRNRRQLKHLN